MNKLFAAVLFGIFALPAVAYAQVLDLTGQADPGSAGQAASAAARPGQPLPVPQQPMLDLSLLEALVAVDGKDLAGVFGFVPESAAAPAFADYVMHNGSALIFQKPLQISGSTLKLLTGIRCSLLLQQPVTHQWRHQKLFSLPSLILQSLNQ